MSKKLLTLSFVILCTIQAIAQYGHYDTTFNSVGRIDFIMNETVVDVISIPGGKTMLLAYHSIAPTYGYEMSLIRLKKMEPLILHLV